MVDAYDNWRDERPDERMARRGPRRSEPRLEQRLDQWVSAGRQLVDGVAGARPGSRPGGRASGLKLDHLGRWVEDKLDWLLDDDEGWRESWEGSDASPQQQQRRSARREPLQAISRRRPARQSVPDADADAWPEEESFSVTRWQRGSAGADAAAPEPPPPVQSGRAVPRSSRRRFD
jgi:hypothetical protein